jgi:PadR family transcriptional regulator PadR
MPRDDQQALKKGSAELLLLSAVERRARHGYEIAQWIARESGGTVTFHAASLYPMLYRLEKRGWIRGVWAAGDPGPRKREYPDPATPRGPYRSQDLGGHWRTFYFD